MQALLHIIYIISVIVSLVPSMQFSRLYWCAKKYRPYFLPNKMRAYPLNFHIQGLVNIPNGAQIHAGINIVRNVDDECYHVIFLEWSRGSLNVCRLVDRKRIIIQHSTYIYQAI